jgi:hypothetical protein
MFMSNTLSLLRFTTKTLKNRMGQEVELHLCHQVYQGRDLLFILAPRQASSFVGKNAEPFAFQLRDLLNLDPKQMDLIEVREVPGQIQLFRWRFEWVGHSPINPRSEEVTSPSQRQHLLQWIADSHSAASSG